MQNEDLNTRVASQVKQILKIKGDCQITSYIKNWHSLSFYPRPSIEVIQSYMSVLKNLGVNVVFKEPFSHDIINIGKIELKETLDAILGKLEKKTEKNK